MFAKQIGARIRELRIQQHLSQQTLAHKLGISPRLVQDYEHGEKLSIRCIIAIAAIFKLEGIKMSHNEIVKYILHNHLIMILPVLII